jgi:hypothetical protein
MLEAETAKRSFTFIVKFQVLSTATLNNSLIFLLVKPHSPKKRSALQARILHSSENNLWLDVSVTA